MPCRQPSRLWAILLTYLLLLCSLLAQETGTAPERTQEDGMKEAVDDIMGDHVVQQQPPAAESNSNEEDTNIRGKWGTGGTAVNDSNEGQNGLPNASEEEDSSQGSSSFSIHREGGAAPPKETETNSKPGTDELKNETTAKRHWGQMLKPPKETAEASKNHSSNHHTSTSSSHGSKHMPIIGKHRDGTSSNAFPEGFVLTARVFTGGDGLAHFDNDEDISLPYIYCGADGSTTAALAVHTAIFREAIAAPTVWNTGDMRPTLAVALRSFRMKLDSGEEQVFQPGDVVLLEDTIRPGHQMVVSDHRDLVVMFVTLQRKHHDIGRENLSIQRASLKQRTCDDGKTKTNADIAARLQSLEWDGRRTRTVILGIVSLSLSTLAADFLAKTAPLWLAVGIGGSVFVAGATFGLTSLLETILTKLHLNSIRRSFDSRNSETKNAPE